MRLPWQIALLSSLLAACATAAPRRPTLEPWGDDPGGHVASAFVASGAPSALASADTLIRADGRVKERLRFEPGHGAFDLAVPDFPEPSWAIELENQLPGQPELDARGVAAAIEKAQPPYKEAEWTSRGFGARIDGAKVAATHRIFALPDGRWIGAFVVGVPKTAREVRLEYVTSPAADSEGAAFLSFDPSGRCTFARQGESVTVFQVGDHPATHVPVVGKPVPGGSCGAPVAPFSFRMEKGQLTSRATGAVPPILNLRLPSGRCQLGREHDKLVVMGTYFACLGVRQQDRRLEEWAKALPRRAYDARSLSLARNWIFALSGRPFTSEELRGYFGQKDWYRPDPDWTAERIDADARAAVGILQRLEQEEPKPRR